MIRFILFVSMIFIAATSFLLPQILGGFSVPALLGLNIKHIFLQHFNLKVNLGYKFRDLGRWMAANGVIKSLR